jgi:hypothetical protein
VTTTPTTTPEAEEATVSTTPTCTTCGRQLATPYRRTVAGEVVEGCVSAAHDAHADAWHLRPAAVAVRAMPKAWADVA